jgi:hypothetical protein
MVTLTFLSILQIILIHSLFPLYNPTADPLFTFSFSPYRPTRCMLHFFLHQTAGCQDGLLP